MKTTSTFMQLHRSRRRQGGLSLVELMISLTIGLLLLAGITSLIVQQSSSRDELEKSSRQIENGRYAMQLLHDDIQLAGFYGEYTPPSGTTYTVPTDPCALTTSSGWATTPTVPVAIYGYQGAATNPVASTCGVTNYKANTAILVVRRTSTATIAASAAAANANYLQVSQCSTASTPFVFGTSASNTSGGGFALLQKDCLTAAQLREYWVDVYYISTCDVCTPSDGIPTLKMVRAGPTASPVLTPLVEGIENMQFDYGLDSTSPVDGSPDSYTNEPVSTDWVNVVAVRVNLLARNNETSMGYTDSKTYNLGMAGTVAPGGSYKRHAYTEVTRAINPSGRRE